MNIAESKKQIGYFSMEIALAPTMPTYSGGLGMLAGDTLRCNFAPKYQRPPLPVAGEYPLEANDTNAIWPARWHDHLLTAMP